MISGNDAGAVTEDLNVSAANTLDYSGKLNVADADQGQASFDTARIDNKTANLGSITIDADGNWHYSVDNAKVQYLGQGDTRTEVFTVYAKDGTAHDITVVVNGVNDAATFSGNDAGAVTEDLNVSAANTLDYSGKLNVADADQARRRSTPPASTTRPPTSAASPSMPTATGTTASTTPRCSTWARATPAPRCSPSMPRTAPPTTSPWWSTASTTPPPSPATMPARSPKT
ncbi:VCBS repeat [Chromobacterium violaceum]|uniref:VCBS repeat n=1 Tax=Chromobacterium violaceum TaxID=536 RepID=A0A447T586_CHRVL|nr:VCBS repeat [Chromobacterium violaceum]